MAQHIAVDHLGSADLGVLGVMVFNDTCSGETRSLLPTPTTDRQGWGVLQTRGDVDPLSALRCRIERIFQIG